MLAGTFGAPSLAHAQTTSASTESVALTLVQPFSPFSEVLYEWKHVGSVPAVAVTRTHAGEYGTDSEVELVSAQALAAYFERLAACPALPSSAETVVAADATDIVPRATLTWTRASGTQTYTFFGAELEAVRPCLEIVRQAVLSHATPDRYIVPFWDPGEFGTLRATASQSARIWVDGRPQHLVTPVNSLRLAPGEHEISWRAVTSDASITRTVTIHEGMTTSTHGQF